MKTKEKSEKLVTKLIKSQKEFKDKVKSVYYKDLKAICII